MSKLILTSVCMAAVLLCAAGCSRGPRTEATTNGTTVVLFPEWTNSASAFERVMCTNLYAVHSNGTWRVRQRSGDGSLTGFWKADTESRTVGEARKDFGMNIPWLVNKAIYDAFAAKEPR